MPFFAASEALPRPESMKFPVFSCWDIADNFGDTNLLVSNMEQGRDLAKCLGGNNVALMRGHGFASAGRTLIEVVRMSVYLPRNARTLMRAKQLGARSSTCRRARLMPATEGTALIRPRPGAPGNTGRIRPVVGICSPDPMTRGHALSGAERLRRRPKLPN